MGCARGAYGPRDFDCSRVRVPAASQPADARSGRRALTLGRLWPASGHRVTWPPPAVALPIMAAKQSKQAMLEPGLRLVGAIRRRRRPVRAATRVIAVTSGSGVQEDGVGAVVGAPRRFAPLLLCNRVSAMELTDFSYLPAVPSISFSPIFFVSNRLPCPKTNPRSKLI